MSLERQKPMPDPEYLRLFPLNIILFPGMDLPLKIFEERYKLLIQECIEEDSPFGVVLIKDGLEVGGPARPHRGHPHAEEFD